MGSSRRFGTTAHHSQGPNQTQPNLSKKKPHEYSTCRAARPPRPRGRGLAAAACCRQARVTTRRLVHFPACRAQRLTRPGPLLPVLPRVACVPGGGRERWRGWIRYAGAACARLGPADRIGSDRDKAGTAWPPGARHRASDRRALRSVFYWRPRAVEPDLDLTSRHGTRTTHRRERLTFSIYKQVPSCEPAKPEL